MGSKGLNWGELSWGFQKTLLPENIPCNFGYFYELKRAISDLSYSDKCHIKYSMIKEINYGNHSGYIKQLRNTWALAKGCNVKREYIYNNY